MALRRKHYMESSHTQLARYLMARNFTKQSKFEEPLCLQRRYRPVPLKFDIKARRQRIADVHNEVKQLVPACDYVLRVEDDTVVPPLTLNRLPAAHSLHPFAGFVEGVELGAGAGTGRQPWARLHRRSTRPALRVIGRLRRGPLRCPHRSTRHLTSARRAGRWLTRARRHRRYRRYRRYRRCRMLRMKSAFPAVYASRSAACSVTSVRLSSA